MLDERVADRNPVARDHLEHPGRDHLLRELGEAQRRQRRLLGRFDDLDVPGRERGAQLPDDHHQRVVPRRDAGDDPERLTPEQRGVALDVLRRSLALEHAGGAREEAKVVDHHGRLVTCDPERLADVAGLELDQLVRVLLDHVGERIQELHPVLGRLVLPLDPGLLGGVDRTLDVVGAASWHLGDHLARRRVQHLHRLAAGSVDPFAADEVLVLQHRNAHVDLRSRKRSRAYTWPAAANKQLRPPGRGAGHPA